MAKASKRGTQVKSSHIISERIDVAVPAEVAFDQWMQYDKWSEIFKNETANPNNRSRRNSKRGGWNRQKEIEVSSKIGPSQRQWTAEIVEVKPPRRVSWRSKGPVKAIGTTTFHSLDERLTSVMVEIEYHPTGVVETVGNFFRMQRRRVRRDLRLFKNYIELRGEATGSGPKRPQGSGLTDDIDAETADARPGRKVS